jgi:hypothetical protein
VFIGTGRRGVAAIAFGGLAVCVVAGCAGHSHKTATISKATAVAPVSDEVHGYVAKVWPDAGRIWPGVVLKDRRIIIGDGKVARLVTVEGVKNLSAADLARRKVTIPASGSLYTNWDGHPAVVINSADPSYADEAKAGHASLSQILFGAATDELFHSWQQRGKPLNQRPQLRGTEYPLAVTPRLYRAMLYDDMVAAYHDPQQKRQRLANAAYWYSRWQKEYPDEARRAAATDGAEGAAGYFDAVAAAMAEGADRNDLGDLREHVSYEPLDQSLDPRRLTVDGEAAPLGALAGLLLDETKSKTKTKSKTQKPWQQQVTQGGQTPLGLLLQGVAPVAEQPSEDLRQGIQDVLAKQNSDLIPRFNPLVRAYNDHGDALLLVPLESATGDLDTGGYYTTKDVPYAMLARLTGTFQFPSGKLKANEASVLTGAIHGRQYVIVPLDPAHKNTRLSDDRLRLDTGPLVGTFRVKAQKMAGREGLVAR